MPVYTSNCFTPDGFLKDKEAGVSQCAAEAIADTGAHGELLLIEGALKDSNPTIRRSSLYGLTRVGAQTIRTLLLACNDREPSVRQVAGEAILCLSLNEIFVYGIFSSFLWRVKEKVYFLITLFFSVELVKRKKKLFCSLLI